MINAAVLAWAQRQLNQRVGRGECWDLAEEAILASNGVSSRVLTRPFRAGADYVWGDRINIAMAQPGDIVQFRNYRWQSLTEVTTIDPITGRSTRGNAGGARMPHHHTAIIVSRLEPGVFQVIHQNVPRGSVVRYDVLRLVGEVSPPVTRSEQRNDISGSYVVQITTRVNEPVTGNIWCYRPRQR